MPSRLVLPLLSPASKQVLAERGRSAQLGGPPAERGRGNNRYRKDDQRHASVLALKGDGMYRRRVEWKTR